MNTSFPFLALARKHNADYGLVIRFAEALWDSQACLQGAILAVDIAKAVYDEKARRAACE